ncbi:NYN domain-containing protein [Methylomonas rivi]|uniref:NYN domain-containing protein n=1 Tax=Methylomonas rivi TaxID=2952226 RepID=A0ABT1U329_9GAMM|nr:NYN domain-containing protein [Methylomonas sp. WSC-6]MCQ8128244.1 NYN domain-containing protein [Methylomonas sp. WSC-6]
MQLSDNKRFALLIDADNAQARSIDAVLTETARYGDTTSRRCYGDWTSTQLASWKGVLNKHAIQPIQQFSYTTGKNATDSALIIDAMDLLYTGKFHGFFLVSSDSDFTRLATRIRESGLEVIGIGKRNTPEPFRAACNKFIFTETIMEDDVAVLEINSVLGKSSIPKVSDSTADERKLSEQFQSPKVTDPSKDESLKKLIKDAIESASEDDGWANLGGVGSYIPRVDSSFDPRNYGFSKLGKLITSLDYVRVEQGKMETGHQNIYVQFQSP